MIKRNIVFVLLLVLGMCFGNEVNYVDNQLIVKFQPDLKEVDLTQMFHNTGYTVEKLLVRRLNLWLISTDPSRTETTIDALEVMKEKPGVIFAQLDHLVTQREFRVEPNDPYFSQMWDMHNTGQSGGTVDADIDAPEAWDLNTGGMTALGDEIVVAVVDGGVQTSHQDLAENIWVNENEIPGNGVDDDGNGYVDDINGWDAYSNDGSIPSDSHGTHVSGTIGAKGNNGTDVVGVSWNVKIMAIAGASGTTSTISIAYGYVLDQKSLWFETDGQKGANVVATNSSFGVDYADCTSGSYPVWNDLYNAMGEVGILSAAATINANQNVDQIGDVPTGCDSDYLISVTNTTRNDVKYSSAGYGATTIDLGAPGTDICSTVPTNSVSCSYTGTSMATPHVAGAVGFLHAVASPALAQLCLDDPALGAQTIKQAILDNVDPLSSLQGVTVSGGRLNLYNSSLALSGAMPSLQYSPGSFDVILNPDQSITDYLTITNNGEDDSELHYTISISPFENPGGGPDGEGNFWADSDNESSIPVDWIDISGIGTQLSFPHNDEAADPVSIGFDFPFYGETYSQCIVNANGWVGFGSDNTTWDNTSIPSISAPSPAIFGFWDDLNPVNDQCNEYCSGNVYYHSNSERLVVWFDEVAHWWTNNENSFYSFQVALYSTGDVQLNYGSITGTHSASIGMQDETGSVGLQVSYNGDYAHNDLSIGFTGEPNWVTVFPDQGVVYANNSENVEVSFNSNGLANGGYNASMKISSNGGTCTIPVTMTVSGESQGMPVSYIEGWNLIGLPLTVENSYYLFLFPDAIEGTLYSYTGVYESESNLENGSGYWLRFNQQGNVSVSGSPLNSLPISISEGWNLLSGISSPVGAEDISDPGNILIPGTLYGYNGTYYNAVSIEPGSGYWVRSISDGEITLSSSGPSRKLAETQNDLLSELGSLIFTNSDGFSGTLFCGVLLSDEELLSYSLPPVPPAGAFDIRFGGDLKIGNEGNEILVQNEVWPLTVEFRNPQSAIPNVDEWYLLDKARGKEYELNGNGTVEITDPTERLTLYRSTLIPEHFALYQNYPNPFNPVTTIQFSVETNSKTSLQIFDITGRLVETLVNENLEPGYHEITWNATNVSSGVYIYKLTTDAGQLTRKMILLK
tara:strand:+ start:9682 stop:13104 length:3423 start_codon:yes stop_codon:yes gene_type:complete